MNQVSELYNYIKQLADEDTFVNRVTKGNFEKLDLDKATMFPLVHASITGGSFTTGPVIVLNIQIGCFDIRDINKEINDDNYWGQDNEVDNHNNTLAVLNRMWLKMYTNLNENNITASENPSLEMVSFARSNLLDGWILTFDVELPNTVINLCPPPITYNFDIESSDWSNGYFPITSEQDFIDHLLSQGFINPVITDFSLTNNGSMKCNLSYDSATQFELYGCFITKINNLDSLMPITYISFNDNQINNLEVIDTLVNLTILDLGFNALTTTGTINNLINLTDLYLGANQISTITNIDSLVNLNRLYLNSNLINTANWNVLNTWAVNALNNGSLPSYTNTDNINTSDTYTTLLAKGWTF